MNKLQSVYARGTSVYALGLGLVFALLISAFGSLPALADGIDTSAVEKQALNPIAIGTFLLFVVSTLAITWWAAKKVHSRSDFLVAGGGLKPWQNGMAIAGDFMSAATFLGITGALYFNGIDAYILGVGIMIGWPIILMVIAERFRNLGRYTFIDVVINRLEERPVRIMASCISLGIITFYLIAQMVGAGTLIQILFGLEYVWAVMIVGVLMVVYVAFGGMVATTWVQVIKATLLLLGGSYLAIAILVQTGFSFDTLVMKATDASPHGDGLLLPGHWFGRDPIAIATVALTMTFGVMGLPHILMRFFTVKDAADARKSVFYATSIMGYFYILILIIGLGSVFVLAGDPSILTDTGALKGGANMVAVHVSRALGGDIMYGFMAAVSFATILAVVAGLTLSGAATIAHDLYASVLAHKKIKEGTEVNVTRYSTISIGIISVLLGLAFEGQNVAVTAAIALAIGASVNFPIILLSLYWGGLTTRGTLWGGYIGLIVCILLILISPGVMVAVLGYSEAIFPYTYPTIIAMPVTFAVIILVSKFDRSDRARKDRNGFAHQSLISELGNEVEGASGH
ncbi:cation/acetate symporter ActP [Kordiimonas sediminis]|uniref:Cation/acetate symporter ActP n=1 Tax=Kordiimonas sediminis TaxID=1735581 RepID=A0A919AQ80_9PROT|nr:cation/acetate symporter ActP [Kordiimonas sediminis]GHF18024.1 cation/acetate symporter ActP [Kordiimonas sediminis]